MVVAVTSVLVVVTPGPHRGRGAAWWSAIVELGDAGSVQLTVAPAQAGFNQIHLYLFDPDGRPAEIAEARHARDEPAVRRPRPDHPRGGAGRPGALPARRRRPGRGRRRGPSRCRRGSTASPRRPGPPRSRSRHERGMIDAHGPRPPHARPRRRRGRPVVVITASPAAADAAGPSDFRSEVTGIVPDVEGVTAEIRGGDSFLELTVDEGHTVIVEGYQGEPYLRFQPDGTVERNRLSTATYLNDDRKGEVDIPAEVTAAGPDAEPEWEEVADGGTYAWHDHRVHWMDDVVAERRPRRDGRRAPTTRGACPIVVDGAAAEVQGTLVYEESVSPLPYLGLGGHRGRAARLLRPTAGPALRRRRCSRSSRWPAVVVGWADYASTPDGGGNPLHWALAGGGARDRGRRRRPRPPTRRRRAGPGQRGRAVGVGAVPHRGPVQARAADRAPLRPRPHRRRARARRERRRRRASRSSAAASASPSSPTTTRTEPTRSQPADLLEAAPEDEADHGHDDDARCSSRSGCRARACCSKFMP